MNGDFNEKLEQVLANPALLAQIKALADTMTENTEKAQAAAPKQESPAPTEPKEDNSYSASLPILFAPSPALEKNLKNTRELLLALKPFLDHKRCAKIDKMLSMMRLAEMAGQFGNLL